MGNYKFQKWIFWAAGGVVMLLIMTVLGISARVGWVLTHPERLPVTKPALTGAQEYREIAFPSRKADVTLQGWYFQSGNSDKTIIFAHGYRKNRLQDDVPALKLALELRENGYNILMFDFRACGESGGNLTTIGQYEKDDLIGAVDFMKKMGRPGTHIGVLGFSMGAVAAILAAEADQRIEAVVADAPFADLEKYLSDNLSYWSGLPAFPFTPLIIKIMPLVLGIDPTQVSPAIAIKNVKVPVLLIHGNADTTIPLANSEEIHRAAPKTTTLWQVPGAKHVGSYKVQPQEYLRRVQEMFQLLDDSRRTL